MTNTNIQISDDSLLEAARQYAPVLKSLPMITLEDTLKYVTPIGGIQGDYVMGQLKASGSWGSYRKNESSGSGSIVLDARTLTTRLLSLEKQFDPNLVAGKLYNQRPNVGDALSKLPIAAQILAQVILEASDELNNNIFSAAYNSSTGTTPATAFDGWDTIAAKEITANKIATSKGNLIDASSNKLDESNTFDFLNYVWLACDEKLKRSAQPVFFYVSPNVAAYYNIGYLATVGSVVYNKDFNQTTIHGSNGKAVIVPVASKADSNYIQVTTKSNMLFGTSDVKDMNTLTVKVPGLYDVLMGGTMWIGTQYEFIESSKLMIVKHGGTKAPTNPFTVTSSSSSGSSAGA